MTVVRRACGSRQVDKFLELSAPPWFYRAYGLSLAANRQIPSLLMLAADEARVQPTDLQIWFEWVPSWLKGYLASAQTLRYVSPYLDDDGQPALIIWLLADGAYYRFHYTEGIDYILSRDGARLWIRWSKTVAESSILSYLLGPVMGFVLRARGVVCLHASAVAVDRRAIVFVGDAGAGKSTTAMAMGRLGYPIISDDIVPIYEDAGVTYAQPGYPRMRLRQPSLPMLSDLNPNLPPLPKWEGQGRLHFELMSGGYEFQSDPLPIGALYLLADRSEDPHAPHVESVSPLRGMMGIVANTYVTRFLDISMRAKELEELSNLVNQVAVRKVHPHREPSRLAMLCNVILEDISCHASKALAV
jgi:hypothetical protein